MTLSPELTYDDIQTDALTRYDEPGPTDYDTSVSWHPDDNEVASPAEAIHDGDGGFSAGEPEATPTIRERLRKYVGRAAAALALTGAALAGSSALSPDEAEAAAQKQGPVACRNSDGATGTRVGELCVVNGQRYGKSSGPNMNDKITGFILGGALGGKCETAAFAADQGAGWGTRHALKVLKAGRYARNANPVGIVVGAGSAAIGNRVCE